MTRLRVLGFLVSSVLALASMPGCVASDGSAPGLVAEPIVGGTLGGDLAVVSIYNAAEGGLCTGTLIAERVVLTAKHCVQPPGAAEPSAPSAFQIGIGDSAYRATMTYRVQSVYTTPGIWWEGGAGGLSGDLVGVDVAAVVLSAPVSGVTPIPVRRTSPRELIGDTFTAIGFGQTPSSSFGGTKYTTTGRVAGVNDAHGIADALIYVGAVTCQGDSGGPMLTADWDIAGVVSFGTGSCGSGYGAYNAIFPFLASVIDPALEEGGICVPGLAEVCDGRDNDCNGMVDETCSPLGERCSTNEECVGNFCRDTVIGRVCTAPCDPRRPELGCEAGFYCAGGGDCNGSCIPLTAVPTLPNGESCTEASECLSLYCADPGDGRQRCLTPCRGNDGACLAGEACAAPAGYCGGCVPEAILGGPRALGESCTSDAQCLDANCLEDGGRSYCTHACAADTDCASRWHCRGDVCASGVRGEVGDPCADNGDCAAERFCAHLGSDHWCTRFCTTVDDCPMGTDCVPAGGMSVCAPRLSLAGEPCASADECLTGLCESAAPGAAPICTRHCGVGSTCPTGLECRRTPDGTDALCAVPAPPSSGGNCSAGASRSAPLGGLVVAGLALLLVLRRREGVAR